MERRCAWSLVGLGLSALLVSGCIARQSTAVETSTATERAYLVDPPAGPPITPPPPPPSNYNPLPVPPNVQTKAAVEPDRERLPLPILPASRSVAPLEEPVLTTAASVVDSPLVAALRCALHKHPREARLLLEKYDKTDRELLLALLQLTAGVGEGEVGKLSTAEMAATLEQLAALTARLRCHARLTLDRVSFCSRIDGFGQFDPLPVTHEFRPGSEGRPGDRVHVYAELRNFTSRNENGQYVTRLASSLEIFDLQNRKVVSLNLGSCVDRCQSRRQDYFLNVQFHVPAKLPAGLYTLRVTVEDQMPEIGREPASRIATRSLDFRVGAGGTVATGP